MCACLCLHVCVSHCCCPCETLHFPFLRFIFPVGMLFIHGWAFSFQIGWYSLHNAPIASKFCFAILFRIFGCACDGGGVISYGVGFLLISSCAFILFQTKFCIKRWWKKKKERKRNRTEGKTVLQILLSLSLSLYFVMVFVRVCECMFFPLPCF